MKRCLIFGRILLWLWAGVLVLAQSQEIGKLRHGREFWTRIAYETTVYCAQALTKDRVLTREEQ